MTLDEKIDETATHVAPYVLSIARVVIALMFMEHGTSKLFGFPAPTATPDPFTLLWFAAIIEIVGGALLALGLWRGSRPSHVRRVGNRLFYEPRVARFFPNRQ
jgi:hypothetical protein